MYDGEKDLLLYYLQFYGKKVKPNDEFWKKAEQHGLSMTYYAIRKASQEENYTIEHIVNLIGNVVKENERFVYKQGVNRAELERTCENE